MATGSHTLGGPPESGSRAIERVVRPSWDDFSELVGSTKERLLVCSPYYSEDGLGHLFDAIPSGPRLTFVSRLSPSDWVNGVADPEALWTLLDLLRENSQEVSFVVHQQLHAKVYLSDGSRGFVGSANLSAGGFDKNFEIMIKLSQAEASAVDSLVQEETPRYGKPLTAETLGTWVADTRQQIMELRREESDAAELATIQRSIDALLGYGGGEPGSVPNIDEYKRWLAINDSLPGADILRQRGLNLDGQNLTGHFRQSYFTLTHFLLDHLDHLSALGAELDSMDQNSIFKPTAAVLEDWIAHVNDHATESGEGYDYAVLRGIMPASLGGTRTGGGGGSSTLKRSFPLVARFLADLAAGE